MTTAIDGLLVYGPWPLPLSDPQVAALDLMRTEAACQNLSTTTSQTERTVTDPVTRAVRTETQLTFTVALRPGVTPPSTTDPSV